MDKVLKAGELPQWTPGDTARANALFERALRLRRGKVIVLDDDPTGVQTVHGVHVYTHWDQASIDDGFSEEPPIFFILTNSRGLTGAQTETVHRDIALRVLESARKTRQSFTIVSRSDSTLRGHFPLETETLRQTFESRGGLRFDGEILCPFFREGGRFTINNIHYVWEGAELTPAARTEFARDSTFGYHHSDLGEWCEEKTGGRHPKESVTYIALETLHACRADLVTEQLMAVRDFRKVVVNAAVYEDVKVFLAGYLNAQAQGKRFMFRTAAAVPKLLGGISDRALLEKEDFGERVREGGLVIAGSHMQKTTAQLTTLAKRFPNLASFTFDVASALAPGGLAKEAERIAGPVQRAIEEGRTALVYTSRKLLDFPGDGEDKLRISVEISNALTDIVARLSVKPAFIVAKGGITSSDIGVKALRVRRALVMGQIAPGIPVWRTDEGSKFPGMPYIIFPGNVGEEETLAEVVGKLVG